MCGIFGVFREDQPEAMHRHWRILEIAKKSRRHFAKERKYLQELPWSIRLAIENRFVSWENR